MCTAAVHDGPSRNGGSSSSDGSAAATTAVEAAAGPLKLQSRGALVMAATDHQSPTAVNELDALQFTSSDGSAVSARGDGRQQHTLTEAAAAEGDGHSALLKGENRDSDDNAVLLLSGSTTHSHVSAARPLRCLRRSFAGRRQQRQRRLCSGDDNSGGGSGSTVAAEQRRTGNGGDGSPVFGCCE